MFNTTVLRAVRFMALTFAVFSVVFQAARADLEYPKAVRRPIVETIHGIDVSDPYRWMEETDSRELRHWVEAQTSIAENFVAGPRYAAARRRIEELSSFDLAFAAKRRQDRLFYLLRPEGDGPVELRVREEGKSRLLLRSDQVPDGEYAATYIGGKGFLPAHWPDRLGNMLVYGYTDGASSFLRWRIIDTRTGRHLPDLLDEISSGFSAVEWSATGNGFYYFRARPASTSSGASSKTEPVGLFYHRLGTPQDEDLAVISQRPDDRHIYSPAVSGDGRYLVVQKREGATQENSYLVFDTQELDSRPRELFMAAGDRSIYLGNDGTRFFFQTTIDAPRGRVIAVDILRPDEIEEVIAESALHMLAGSNVGGDVLGLFGGHFVLGYMRDGLPEIQLFDQQGSFERVLELPAGATIWGGLQGVPGQRLVTAGLLNPLSPSHTITFDVADGSVTNELTANVPFDRADFLVRRIFFESADGTRVPMSVMHHKDVVLDGSNPALIYGYGMHKWVSFLFYQAHILHWMELGGVYAMPAIRGGGEYGDPWHAAGIKQNRQNAVDDFVAAGRWLIDAGYTSPSRLAANGGSASGALAGVIPLRYGEVFAATTVDYPIADLVRAPLYGNGALLVEEYGSLDDPAEAHALIGQSPYHQARSKSCHMPTLVMVGEDDRVALPFHGYKYVAAMQHTQACENPVLLKLMRNTGHNYGLSSAQIAENAGLQIAFLRTVLGF